MSGDAEATVDLALVRHVARLARIELSDADAEAYRGDLVAMLRWLRTLADADVDDVEPLIAPDLPLPPPRPDVAAPGLTEATLRAMAPDFRAGGFIVPRVVE